MMDYKNYRAHSKASRSSFLVVAIIIAIIALMSWMGERDRAHTAEIEFQRQVINGFVSICPIGYDNAPAIEMGMPIGES